MPSSSAAGHDDSDSQMSTKSGSSEEEPESAISSSGRGRTEEAKTWGQMFRIWPYHSFLIVIMEFSMMLTALNNVFNLYYINVLQFSPETTVILLNINGIIGGFTRLFGSAISDSYLGKFRAIFFGSCIFIVGKLIMTTATFLPPGPPHPYMDFAAVFIIMVGTSAMGPSIAPFAGDQFEPHQEKMISLFYSIFYASINIGAMISNIMMPVLRARPCFGKDSCYPLSFGVSTLGVITAFIIFVVGSKRYVRRPPKGNIFTAVYHVIKTARHNKAKSGKKAASTKDHWLDFYFDTHSCEQDPKCQELQKKEGDPGLCQKEQFVEDLRCLLRLLVVFIPMPMFWALYDQQYTVWMNQALMLDCRIWGNFRLLPDQMQVVNPVLIIVLIFLFQSFIYPMVERFVVLTPLRKMVAGGLIASLAFLVSGAVQLMINPTLPDTPPSGQAFVSVVNTFQNCSLEIRDEHGVRRQLFPNSSLINDKMAGRNELFHVDMSPPPTRWTVHGQGNDCPKKTMMMNGNGTADSPLELTFEVLSPVNFLSIGPAGAFLTAADSDKPTGGAGQFKIGVVLAFDNGGAKNGTNGLAFCRVGTECDHHAGKDFYVFTSKTGSHHNATEHVPFVWGEGEATVYPFIEVRPGRWKLYHLYNEPEQSMPKAELLVEPVGGQGGQGVEFEMQEQGGIYALILTGSRAAPRVTVHQVVPHNGVSILWQLPQIFIISVAEILVSITGLEFAYSQSGPSMKAIASACWGLTVSLGSIIIIIVTLLPIENLATKAFLCAGAMLLDVLLFAFLAKYCYQYRRGTSAASSSMLVSSSTAGLKPPNMQKASLATTMTETTAKSGDVGGLAERKNINGAGKLIFKILFCNICILVL